MWNAAGNQNEALASAPGGHASGAFHFGGRTYAAPPRPRQANCHGIVLSVQDIGNHMMTDVKCATAGGVTHSNAGPVSLIIHQHVVHVRKGFPQNTGNVLVPTLTTHPKWVVVPSS